MASYALIAHLFFQHWIMLYHLEVPQSPASCPHSPIERHLGFFQVLATIIKLLHTFVYMLLCEHKFSTHLGKYQRAWSLAHIARVCLVWYGTATLFSKVVPFYLPNSSEWEFLLLHNLVSNWCRQCSVGFVF